MADRARLTDGDGLSLELRAVGEERVVVGRLAVLRGYPAVLRWDNGPELACAAMADWAGERTGLHFIPSGQPWRNG